MNIRINKNDIEGASNVILVILTVVGLIGLVFFETFVLMKCWNWFIVPATGWNEIEYWLTFGISLTVNLFKGFTSNKYEETSHSGNSCVSAFSTVVTYYVVIALFLGIGALVHLGV